MNVLVLGDSDTSGRFSDGVTWPGLLRDSLAADGAREVVMTAIPFSAASPAAHTYAEKQLTAIAPDVVVLVLGSYPFTAKFVWLRIERLLGKRAGRWYKSLEDSFDAKTAQRGGPGARMNKVARWLVPKVAGSAPFCSRAQLTENYRKVFSTLARFEDTRIIIMSYPGLGAHARQGNAPAERAIFFAEIQAAAKGHHYTWVDGVQIFAGSSGTLKRDQLHFNADGHRLMATAIEGAVLGAMADIRR